MFPSRDHTSQTSIAFLCLFGIPGYRIILGQVVGDWVILTGNWLLPSFRWTHAWITSWYEPCLHSRVLNSRLGNTVQSAENQTLAVVKENQILGFEWKCITLVERRPLVWESCKTGAVGANNTGNWSLGELQRIRSLPKCEAIAMTHQKRTPPKENKTPRPQMYTIPLRGSALLKFYISDLHFSFYP